MTVRRKKLTLRNILPILAILAAAGFLLCSRCSNQLFHTIADPIIAVFSGTQSDEAATVQETQPQAPSVAEDTVENQTSTPPLSEPPAVSDVAITELQTHGEIQLLTGGPIKIVYYLQSDEQWGDLRYGSDKISTHGCGPTAMAMVVSTLTGTLIDPPSMAEWAVQNGYWARHSGSYHSIVIGTATAFGLRAEAFSSRDADALREQLFAGKLFVALMGPGHFTQSGHFIVLRGVTLSGDILVADPGSIERSLTAWDVQLILDELSTSTADGSPLWLISLPEGTDIE